MKKLVYLFLTVLIVACSGSDDDSNAGVTLNAQFVGSWLTEFDDDEGGSLLLEFNADGTGSENFVLDGESDTEVFTWSTTSTIMTVTYAPDDVDELMYEFLTDDQVKFTINEDDETYEIIFDRVID
tara:strand:+ start:122 stop:499 length:378 start_codon:yes stop_codon:yes gene_type:complete